MPTSAYAVVGTIRYYCIEDFFALGLAELLEFGREGFVIEGQDGHRIECGVLGTVDGHGGHGNSGRHLYNGQEGVHTHQRLGFYRHPYHGERGVGGDDSGQVGGPAGAGNHNFTAFVRERGHILCQGARIAVCREHFFLVGNAKFVEGGHSRRHYIIVAGTAHDNCNLHKNTNPKNKLQSYSESSILTRMGRRFFGNFSTICCQ